jgi:hypothetical protein
VECWLDHTFLMVSTSSRNLHTYHGVRMSVVVSLRVWRWV